jgi:hypothetical protein
MMATLLLCATTLAAVPPGSAAAQQTVTVEGMRYRTPQEMRFSGGSVIVKMADGRLVVGGAEGVPIQGLAYLFPDENILQFLIGVQYEEGRLRPRVFFVAREAGRLTVKEQKSLKVGEGPETSFEAVGAALYTAFQRGAPQILRQIPTNPLFAPDSPFGAVFVSFFRRVGARQGETCIPHFGWSIKQALVMWYYCVTTEGRVWYYTLEVPPRAPDR